MYKLINPHVYLEGLSCISWSLGMDFNSAELEKALILLGEILSDKGHSCEIVAIGGGSLLLLGQLLRPTKDLDIVAVVNKGVLCVSDPLPKALLEAVQNVSVALKLGKDWINCAPSSLMKQGLPSGFTDRMHTRYYGSLVVHLADRFDQICFKLYASVDHGPDSKHYKDLLSLKPTKEARNCKKMVYNS